jgi:hypothetical protein
MSSGGATFRRIVGRVIVMRIFASVHMAKTAGSSFAQLLIDVVSHQFPVFFYYGTGHPLTGIWSAGARLEAEGAESSDRLTEIFIQQTERNGAGLVQAHWLVSEFLEIFGGDTLDFITWLRDPVQRICSMYFFWKDSKFEPRRPEVRELFWAVKSDRCSLLEFGTHPQIRDYYRNVLAPLDLEAISFAGIFERQEVSLRCLSRLLGMTLPERLQLKNITKRKQTPTYSLSKEVEEGILAHNVSDAAIYAAALARLDQLDSET